MNNLKLWKELEPEESMTEISTAEHLTSAFDEGKSLIKLSGDITVSQTVTIADGKDITLDLNGQPLTWQNEIEENNTSLFWIERDGVFTATDTSDTVGSTVNY